MKPERWSLLGVMLGLSTLGSLAATIRAVWLEGPQWWVLLIWVGGLLIPNMLLAALCLWVLQRWGFSVAWGAGLVSALAAAWCQYVLLNPELNRDANIGLGLYWLFGWAVVLLPVALIGGLIGAAWQQLKRR